MKTSELRNTPMRMWNKAVIEATPSNILALIGPLQGRIIVYLSQHPEMGECIKEHFANSGDYSGFEWTSQTIELYQKAVYGDLSEREINELLQERGNYDPAFFLLAERIDVIAVNRLGKNLFLIKNKFGASFAHCAAALGQLELVKQLWESDPNSLTAVDNCGEQPVHYAALSGHVEVLKYLISINPELLTAVDGYGAQPLHCAVGQDRNETIVFLLNLLIFEEERSEDLCFKNSTEVFKAIEVFCFFLLSKPVEDMSRINTNFKKLLFQPLYYSLTQQAVMDFSLELNVSRCVKIWNLVKMACDRFTTSDRGSKFPFILTFLMHIPHGILLDCIDKQLNTQEDTLNGLFDEIHKFNLAALLQGASFDYSRHAFNLSGRFFSPNMQEMLSTSNSVSFREHMETNDPVQKLVEVERIIASLTRQIGVVFQTLRCNLINFYLGYVSFLKNNINNFSIFELVFAKESLQSEIPKVDEMFKDQLKRLLSVLTLSLTPHVPDRESGSTGLKRIRSSDSPFARGSKRARNDDGDASA